jgi:hypothetical protein
MYAIARALMNMIAEVIQDSGNVGIPFDSYYKRDLCHYIKNGKWVSDGRYKGELKPTEAWQVARLGKDVLKDFIDKICVERREYIQKYIQCKEDEISEIESCKNIIESSTYRLI